MAPSPDVAKARARLAGTLRQHPDADVTELRRDLAAESLAAHVRAVVAGFPPLSPEQRDKIATLLHHPSSPSGGGDATP